MTKPTPPDEEMVTISYEVPVSVARKLSQPGMLWKDQYNHDRQEACKAALDARKSPYERWLEKIDDGATAESLHNDGYHPKNAQLMAAAPQLLEALIANYEWGQGRELWKANQTRDAIRAAVPEDVADFLLKGTK